MPIFHPSLPRRKALETSFLDRMTSGAFRKMKHAASLNGGGRRKGKHSVFVAVFTVLIFFLFMYNEDVKSIAEYPFSSRAKSPDLSHEEFPMAEPSRVAHHVQQATTAVQILGEVKVHDESSKNYESSKITIVVDVAQEQQPQGEEQQQELPISEEPVQDPKSEQKDTLSMVVEPQEDSGGATAVEHTIIRVVDDAPAEQQPATAAKSETKPEQPQPQPEAENPNGGDGGAQLQQQQQKQQQQEQQQQQQQEQQQQQQRFVLDVPETCDLFTGRWVYDDKRYPIYKEHECSFLTEQVTCMRNGRRDDGYQKWRWKPRDCSLPRFDAKLMMERLRGKRLVFVGDSLNRNQWESMLCLVQSVSPWEKKTLTKGVGNFNIFRLEEYNATVEFYWAPFLVESNSDDPRIHSIQNRIIMPGSIDKHGDHWKGVDYLVFNTYIWWMNTPNMKVLRGSFDNGSTEYDEVERPVAYRRVLRTWAKWVQNNVDPKKTMVFFMSMSPNHIHSTDWDNPNGIKCALETEPVAPGNLSHPLNVGTDWRMFSVAESVIRSMRKKVPVEFIKITGMSELRKDAHTSVHTLRQGKLLTKEEQADPQNFADCIHWCLPGLPDLWNHFIYAKIASSPWDKDTTTTSSGSSSS